MTTRSVLAAGVDWTNVIIVGIPSILSAVFAGVAMVKSTQNRGSLRTGNGYSIGQLVQQTRDRTEDLKTPSGDPIGDVAERTHDLAAVTVASVAKVERKVNGG